MKLIWSRFVYSLMNVLIVQAPSEKNLDWGKINVGVAPEVFKNIYAKAVKHYNDNVDKMWVY